MRRRLTCLVFVSLLLVLPGVSLAQQSMFQPQSDLDVALPDYLAEAGPDAKLVEPGQFKLDGHRMVCGKRPTVIDNKFDSWGGAYPGYLIMNMDRLKELPTPVKLFVFAHECGHQFVGRDEDAADCFGAKRGRRYGWLDEEGLAQVCEFLSKLKATSDHASGPARCEAVKKCYLEAAPRASRKPN